MLPGQLGIGLEMSEHAVSWELRATSIILYHSHSHFEDGKSHLKKFDLSAPLFI